jgi:hypothetical protein
MFQPQLRVTARPRLMSTPMESDLMLSTMLLPLWRPLSAPSVIYESVMAPVVAEAAAAGVDTVVMGRPRRSKCLQQISISKGQMQSLINLLLRLARVQKTQTKMKQTLPMM